MTNRAENTASRRQAEAQLPLQGQIAFNGKHVARADTGHMTPFSLTACLSWVRRGGDRLQSLVNQSCLRYMCRRFFGWRFWWVPEAVQERALSYENQKCRANHASMVPYWLVVLRL